MYRLCICIKHCIGRNNKLTAFHLFIVLVALQEVMSLGQIMPLSTSSNVGYTIAKLQVDGGNWVTWKGQTMAIIGARGLTRHLEGNAQKPPVLPKLSKAPTED